MSPGHKRQVARAFVDRGRCTIRAACRHFGLHRSTFRYRAKQPDAWHATHRGHVWTWDFVHDTTVRGGTLRMFNVIDEHTRECLCIYVARRINASKVRRIMADLVDVHGAPGYIRSDNGSEFIEAKLRAWLAGVAWTATAVVR